MEKNDPKHFFVKLFNYLENYKIENEEEKIRVLKSCLDGPALDLYLALGQKKIMVCFRRTARVRFLRRYRRPQGPIFFFFEWF